MKLVYGLMAFACYILAMYLIFNHNDDAIYAFTFGVLCQLWRLETVVQEMIKNA